VSRTVDLSVLVDTSTAAPPTGLGALDRERFTLLAPFFRLDDGEAAPCRIFAMFD
jgi:hypothetical protein